MFSPHDCISTEFLDVLATVVRDTAGMVAPALARPLATRVGTAVGCFRGVDVRLAAYSHALALFLVHETGAAISCLGTTRVAPAVAHFLATATDTLVLQFALHGRWHCSRAINDLHRGRWTLVPTKLDYKWLFKGRHDLFKVFAGMLIHETRTAVPLHVAVQIAPATPNLFTTFSLALFCIRGLQHHCLTIFLHFHHDYCQRPSIFALFSVHKARATIPVDCTFVVTPTFTALCTSDHVSALAKTLISCHGIRFGRGLDWFHTDGSASSCAPTAVVELIISFRPANANYSIGRKRNRSSVSLSWLDGLSGWG